MKKIERHFCVTMYLFNIKTSNFNSFESTKKWCKYFYNFIKEKNIC